MKKTAILSLVACGVLAISSSAQAQERTLKVNLKSGNPVEYNLSDIESLTFSTSQATEKQKFSTITTIAGAGTSGKADGKGTAAKFKDPEGLSLASDGTFWITDRSNHRIVKMDSEYNVSAIYSGTQATFYAPWLGGFAPNGDYYVPAKGISKIFKIAAGTTAAVDVTPSSVTFSSPMQVLFDADGYMYIANRDASTAGAERAVYKFNSDGTVAKKFDLSDTKGGATAIAVDKKGNLFVGTKDNYIVYMFDKDGNRTAILGNGTKPTSADGYADGDPLSTITGEVFGLLLDNEGVLYVSDSSAGIIRTLTPDASGNYAKGTLKTIAGKAYAGTSTDGDISTATLKAPAGMLLVNDTLYFTETGSHTIRMMK